MLRAERARSVKGPREKIPARSGRRDLVECLREAAIPLAPEDLMELSGFTPEGVGEFYEELAAAVASGAIREIRDEQSIRLELGR
jgi:hypothetical protein